MSPGAEPDRSGDESSLIEDFGREIGGAMGWPRTAGRVAAVLMLSEVPMTLAQLQHALGASKGSVSETTRLLMTNGTVTRFKQPGTRHFVYQWRADAWVGCLQYQLGQVDRLRELAERADTRATELPALPRARIRKMREYYRFMVRRLETLLAEYDAQWGERHAATET